MPTVLQRLDHLRDAAEREASGNDPSARAQLVKGIQELQAVVDTPNEKLLRLVLQFMQNACMRIALECGFLQTLAAASDRSWTAREVAEATNREELLVARIMRMITTLDFADEVGPSTYRANETTKFGAQKGVVGAYKYTTDINMRLASNVGPLVSRSQFHQFPEGDDQQDPFTLTFGQEYFPFLKEHREYGQAFDDFMAIRRSPTSSKWFEIFPAADSLASGPSLKHGQDEALLVDVAGGLGGFTQQFKTAFGTSMPGRVIVQDQPLVLKKAQLEGVEKMEYDFFTPQPIKGARLYFFKNIMHDWSDKTNETILRNTVEAMEKGYSTLLINDYVMPEENAPLRAVQLDITLMFLNSGIQRNEKQWATMLKSAGLRIVKIWTVGGISDGNEPVIECEKM